MRAWCAALALAALSATIARPAAAQADVDVQKNISYDDGRDADPVRHTLDLYLPKGRKGFPVLIFVHGGGWSSGSKDQPTYARLGRVFASSGVATVVINYRLSPQVAHPAHVQDVARAFAWVRAHIGELGGRVDRIFLCGHSSGGHLVALVATDPVYLEAVGLSPSDISGVIPISGVYTIVPELSLYRPAFGTDPDVCRDASPIAHVRGKQPPFLILYGDRDLFLMRLDAQHMAQLLQAAGTDVTIREVADRSHQQMVQIRSADDPVARAVLGFVWRP